MPDSDFLQQLQQQRFAVVEFPLRGQPLRKTAQAFMDFLALPPVVKRQLHFPARSKRASADGYTDKLAIGDKDPKEFFHWSPAIVTQTNYRMLEQQNPVVTRFFAAAERLYATVNDVLHPLFAEQFPDYLDELFDGDTLRDGTLRFLSYAPKSPNATLTPQATPLPQRASVQGRSANASPDDSATAAHHGSKTVMSAKAHFDKGFSTLAIAESAPGLRIGSCHPEVLRNVQHADGKALFMPAWMLYERSGGQILPAWHDVVHNPQEPNITPYCARWAMVFFINHPNKTFSSWQSVHSPLGEGL